MLPHAPRVVDGFYGGDIKPNGSFTLPTDFDTRRISLRLRSDRTAAVENTRARAFWPGTLVVPLDDIKRAN